MGVKYWSDGSRGRRNRFYSIGVFCCVAFLVDQEKKKKKKKKKKWGGKGCKRTHTHSPRMENGHTNVR